MWLVSPVVLLIFLRDFTMDVQLFLVAQNVGGTTGIKNLATEQTIGTPILQPM
jgi:hypothetical protein